MNFTVRLPHRISLSVGAAVPTLLIVAAGISNGGAQPPSSSPGELSGQKFKNIKVLKNLPADKLIPAMHDWSMGLGVKCDYCHVINQDHTGFERDDKPAKRTARAMYSMVVDLNRHQRVIDRKATCFLCHHGKAMPEIRPEGEGPGRR